MSEIADIRNAISNVLSDATEVNTVYVYDPVEFHGDYPIATIWYMGIDDQDHEAKGSYLISHRFDILLYFPLSLGQESALQNIDTVVSNVLNRFRNNDTLSGGVLFSNITSGEVRRDERAEQRFPRLLVVLNLTATKEIRIN